MATLAGLSPKRLNFLWNTARSCLPSPLKSPTTIEPGVSSKAYLLGDRKPTSSAPIRIPTLPLPEPTIVGGEVLLATPRSCLPSRLNSPTAKELVWPPAKCLIGARELHDWVQGSG